MAIANHNILSVTQDLTEEEQSIVRQNIGAASSSEIGGVPYTLDEKNRLAGMETGAQVNTIETITMEGESGELPISSKDVTIPLAASATTSPVAAAKTGLMSGTDKAKLDEAVVEHRIKYIASTMTVTVDDTPTTVDVYVLADMAGTALTTDDIVAMINAHERIVLVEAHTSNTSTYVVNDYDVYSNGGTDKVTLNFVEAYNNSNGDTIVSRVAHFKSLEDDGDRVGCEKPSGASRAFVDYDSVWPDAGTDLTYDSNDNIMVNTTGTISNNAQYAFVEGKDTVASGDYSHAEGNTAIASGEGAHAEGCTVTLDAGTANPQTRTTTASGNYSHAEGAGTRAQGAYTHAEGCFTTASRDAAHSEGSRTTATGSGAHAGGYGTTVAGYGYFGHGTFLNFTNGTSTYEEHPVDIPVFVCGTLNATQAQDTAVHGGYLMVVGNGTYTGSGTGTRSDAFILHKDGTVKATAFQNASGTETIGGASKSFSGIDNIEVFANGTVDPANFPQDNVLRIILEA